MQDNYLYERINEDLELCEFNKDLKMGILFFLGASIQNYINLKFTPFQQIAKQDPDQLSTIFKNCVNAYSEPSGDFEQAFAVADKDLGEIQINNLLYTHAHIATNILGEADEDINDRFRNMHPAISLKVVRCEFIEDFIKDYDIDWLEYRIENKLCLNVFYNLQQDLFERIGAYVNQTGMSNQQAYEAGYAYFNLMTNFDTLGTKFLIDSVVNPITPLFNCFLSYPIINNSSREALRYNHLFSHLFQYFSGSVDPIIGMPIHKYHQVVFYNDDSSFREEWKFKKENDVDIASQLFLYGCEIRNTDLINDHKNYLSIEGISFPALKNKKLTTDDFRWEIELGIFKKYGIRSPRHGEDGWSNNGDFIQFCAIYFYEICVHSLVIGELSH